MPLVFLRPHQSCCNTEQVTEQMFGQAYPLYQVYCTTAGALHSTVTLCVLCAPLTSVSQNCCCTAQYSHAGRLVRTCCRSAGWTPEGSATGGVDQERDFCSMSMLLKSLMSEMKARWISRGVPTSIRGSTKRASCLHSTSRAHASQLLTCTCNVAKMERESLAGMH
jgi:hypothetical protein